MAERKTKIYCEDGKRFSFDFDGFSLFFQNYCRSNKLKILDAEIRIGEKIAVSEHTIHGWRNRVNAPVDISLVRELAAELGTNETNLLIKRKEEITMENLNEKQIESTKRIYDSIVEALFTLKNNRPDYYGEYFDNLISRYPEEDEEDVYDEDSEKNPDGSLNYEICRINEDLDKVRKVIAQEYFYLHDTEIYDKFSSFCDNELFMAYFTSPQGDSELSDYFYSAIKKLHVIIGTEESTDIYLKETKADEIPLFDSDRTDTEDSSEFFSDENMPF